MGNIGGMGEGRFLRHHPTTLGYAEGVEGMQEKAKNRLVAVEQRSIHAPSFFLF
jgi:hypothetical protein